MEGERAETETGQRQIVLKVVVKVFLHRPPALKIADAITPWSLPELLKTPWKSLQGSLNPPGSLLVPYKALGQYAWGRESVDSCSQQLLCELLRLGPLRVVW